MGGRWEEGKGGREGGRERGDSRKGGRDGAKPGNQLVFSKLLHGLLTEHRYRLERYGRRCFSVAGPALWNELPTPVK